jgi:hypothetical protein
MPDALALVSAVVGGALVGSALTFAVAKYRTTARQLRLAVTDLAEIKTRLAKLEADPAPQPCSRHDVRHIVRADVGEAFLFDFAKLREDVEVMARRLECFTQHAQHVAAGGSPDDPPSTWGKESK